MKSLVIYDSVFGNTEKVAAMLAKALGDGTRLTKVDRVTAADLEGINFLVVGSPTRGFKPTEGMVKWLNEINGQALSGIIAAVFDTRIPLETISSKFFRAIVKMGGYADKPMAEVLKKKGVQVIATEGFFVADREGPLVEGELARASSWIVSAAQKVPISPI